MCATTTPYLAAQQTRNIQRCCTCGPGCDEGLRGAPAHSRVGGAAAWLHDALRC